MLIFLRDPALMLAGLILLTQPAAGKRIALPPLSDQIGAADCILVGKVTAVEPKTVKVENQGEMAVAVVKVEEGLLGTQGLTHVKVAFPAGALTPGTEGLLLLQKVTGETFYTFSRRPRGIFPGILQTDDPGEKKQVESVKRAAKLLAEPAKSLQSKDAEERVLTAALLLGRYRPSFFASEKQEPVPAAESKLILEALAGAEDWNKFDQTFRFNPTQLFQRLGVTPADGWNPPQDFRQLAPAAKEWLKANSDKFRIKRFVLE